jgi:hypothetical protein
MSETRVDVTDIRKKVLMVYSLPRVALTVNMDCAIRVAGNLSLTYARRSSAYWSLALELVMAEAVEKGFEYVLTVDMDSVFTPNNVLHLYALCKQNPHIDAVAAMQIKRATDLANPLFCVRGEDGKFATILATDELNGELFKVCQAHFGLTLIRCSALVAVPRPWFLRLPDSETDTGSLDDDIYFWRQWEKHGKSIYIACHNSIGHVQEVVTWPDAALKPVHQLWRDFEENGRPETARGIDSVVKRE